MAGLLQYFVEGRLFGQSYHLVYVVPPLLSAICVRVPPPRCIRHIPPTRDHNLWRSLPRQRADRQSPPAVRFRAVDVQDLFEDSRCAPVSRLAPGYSVYRRPRMEEEGVPANAELV